MTAQRFLLTGAAGFIGSAFLRCLLTSNERCEVMTFDALTYAGHKQNLEGLEGAERHVFFEGDIANPRDVARAFHRFRPEALVNFAAETHVDRSILDPLPFIRTNVRGTQVLLDAARAAGIRMLQISTDEVYGSLEPPERALPVSPLLPGNPYSATKAAADLLVLSAFRTHGQDVLITRSTNNYGPRQTPEKLIPLMILRARAGQRLPVYGDGLHVRDWLHVEDHAAGILAALQAGRPGAIYHFAGSGGHTNLEVVGALLGAVGAAADLIEHVADRPGHDRRYALDDQSTRAELSWAPGIDFEDGLAGTARWYEQHPGWTEAVAGADLRAFLEANYQHRGG